jgi:protein ImuA
VADLATVEKLQRQINALHLRKQVPGELKKLGLGALESSFPGGVFPRAAVHELISSTAQNSPCTTGFISLVLSRLLTSSSVCIWISDRQAVYPPALKAFGVAPEKIVFVNTIRQKDTIWAIEEAMKCTAVTAVVGELRELSFDESRRLQLAAEQSRVTAFIHRHQPRAENAVACVTRWRITPLESINDKKMPGVGFPRWHASLVKVRNGKPGSWRLQWSPAGLEYFDTVDHTKVIQLRTGSHD